MSRVELICEDCNKPFTRIKTHHKSYIARLGVDYVKLCAECNRNHKKTRLHVNVTCRTCGKKFVKIFKEKDKHKISSCDHFCSRSCNTTHQNRVRKSHKGETKFITCEKCNQQIKVSKFSPQKLCQLCRPKRVRDNRHTKKFRLRVQRELMCVECKKVYINFTRYPSTRKYCSSCLHKKRVASGLKSVKIQASVRRSKNESYFAELCQKQFSNVRCNEQFFESQMGNWDADVILHDQKIAVLWNGLWHYKKLKNKHSVKQVQARDKIKLSLIKKVGYTSYVIKDTGKFDPVFVENEFEKFIVFVQSLHMNIEGK